MILCKLVDMSTGKLRDVAVNPDHVKYVTVNPSTRVNGGPTSEVVFTDGESLLVLGLPHEVVADDAPQEVEPFGFQGRIIADDDPILDDSDLEPGE